MAFRHSLDDQKFPLCVCPARWAHRCLLPNRTSQWFWCCLNQDHRCSITLWKILHYEWKQDLDQVAAQSHLIRMCWLSPQGGSVAPFLCVSSHSAMEVWLRSLQCSPRLPRRTPKLGRWRTRSQHSLWKRVLEEWHSELSMILCVCVGFFLIF